MAALEITHATVPTPGGGGVNEDSVATGARYALVLDGATATGAPTGCVHDVAWYVRHLTARLAATLAVRDEDCLREILREAIADLVADHSETCDMSNPDSPSSTVAIIRVRDDALDVLSLADSPVAVQHRDGRVEVIVDDRTSHLPSYTRDAVRAARNNDNGFWVASTKPEAADRAVTASIPLDSVDTIAVLSDGASRLPERYGWSWESYMSQLASRGPSHIIAETRRAEAQPTTATFRGKPHDDATAVLCRVSHQQFLCQLREVDG